MYYELIGTRKVPGRSMIADDPSPKRSIALRAFHPRRELPCHASFHRIRQRSPHNMILHSLPNSSRLVVPFWWCFWSW